MTINTDGMGWDDKYMDGRVFDGGGVLNIFCVRVMLK